jgi:hypothetical protein
MRERDLALPFTPSAATSMLALHAFESSHRSSYVDLLAIADTSERWVRLNFARCVSAKLTGYARTTVRGRLCEILDSPWVEEAVREQHRLFPDTPNTARSLRHFVLRGHDATVEVLADDFSWEFLAPEK